MEYYVKWKDLPYDQCTWEKESDMLDFSSEVHRYEYLNSKEHAINAGGAEQQRDFKELKEQPEYIGYSLYPFQLEGINWLRYSWAEKKSVILADEV